MGKDILKDLGIDGTSMDLRAKRRTTWSGLFWLRIGTVGCCSELGNVISNSANCEECCEELLASQEEFRPKEFPVYKHKE